MGVRVGGGGGKGFVAWGKWRGKKSSWVLLPQASYPENFVLVSQLEVCQEGGVKKGGTWRMLGVPDRRHGGQSHS